MNVGVGQVAVRKHLGHMVVTSFGQTPRGQKFLKGQVRLEATRPAGLEFKRELGQAVDQLLGSAVPTP